MPDISACQNIKCPLALGCYRYMCVPDKHWQSYSLFSPDKKGNCKDYWPLSDNYPGIRKLRPEEVKQFKNIKRGK